MTALQNKFFLVTRTEEQSATFRSLLESRGAKTMCLPAIQIVDPDSWEDCDSAIWKLAEYFAVCFTSKNAVEKFISRIRSIRPNALHTLSDCKLFAVGEKTKAALYANGFSSAFVPQHASARELAAALHELGVKGQHILFPKSNIARIELPEQLRAAGATIDEVIAYKTVLPDPVHLDTARQMLQEKRIDAATFFSPSSVVNVVEMLGTDLLAQTVIAAIGATTAEAVTQAGLHTNVVAPQATSESLASELERYFSH
ncbi:MAG TPA: uroporphyrinogen-III synthase [Bacteroidota bacterium]|nr:uroporphyrinogen-III synthase [Bacteroidota bacterium]